MQILGTSGVREKGVREKNVREKCGNRVTEQPNLHNFQNDDPRARDARLLQLHQSFQRTIHYLAVF